MGLSCASQFRRRSRWLILFLRFRSFCCCFLFLLTRNVLLAYERFEREVIHSMYPRISSWLLNAWSPMMGQEIDESHQTTWMSLANGHCLVKDWALREGRLVLQVTWVIAFSHDFLDWGIYIESIFFSCLGPPFSSLSLCAAHRIPTVSIAFGHDPDCS